MTPQRRIQVAYELLSEATLELGYILRHPVEHPIDAPDDWERKTELDIGALNRAQRVIEGVITRWDAP